MCGIAGWLGDMPEAGRQAATLARCLRHRGPDASDHVILTDAGLVHTRLSIIDLSDAGRQPMANEDSQVWVVYNGEIYNHNELRGELQPRGHVFRGHSDTQVLPHGYEEHGKDILRRLRGMFAIALYDARCRTLLLARDRFGIKPLFYAVSRSRLVFASELNALLQMPGIDCRPDRQAIHDYVALSYVPAPQTFYTGIRALEPGSWLEAQLQPDGHVATTAGAFHTWAIAVPDDRVSGDVVERAEALVRQAVTRQLESDVPLGAFLSGGIDSSLVSSAAQSALGRGLRTFNVRFSDAAYDETWAAQQVAAHIGSDHQTLDIDSTPGSWDHISGLLLHAGQPFADTSLFAVNAVCRAMRPFVAVALSGDGGDEGFGGYDPFWQIARIARFQRFARTGGKPILSALLSPLAQAGVISEHLSQRMDALKDADDPDMLQSLFCWVPADEHRALCAPMVDVLPVRRWFMQQWEQDLPRRASRLERLSATTTEIFVRLTMANDFLFKVDLASMRESLEVRVPMLDEELFAFGLSLPHAGKVKGRACKRVLRAVAERWLPQSVAHKPKRGFAIPVDDWATSEFKRRVRQTLLDSGSPLDEFLRPEIYKPIISAFCDGRPHPGTSRAGLYHRAIMLLALHLNLNRAESRTLAGAAGALA